MKRLRIDVWRKKGCEGVMALMDCVAREEFTTELHAVIGGWLWL